MAQDSTMHGLCQAMTSVYIMMHDARSIAMNWQCDRSCLLELCHAHAGLCVIDGNLHRLCWCLDYFYLQRTHCGPKIAIQIHGECQSDAVLIVRRFSCPVMVVYKLIRLVDSISTVMTNISNMSAICQMGCSISHHGMYCFAAHAMQHHRMRQS